VDSNSGAEFTAAVEHNLTKAESFYKARHAIIRQRMSALHDHYGVTECAAFDSANLLELEDLTAAFNELRDAWKQLQWYELVNFNKIVGRLAKFEGRVAWPPGSSSLRIPDTHLAIRIECLKSLRYVNDVLARLQSKEAKAHPGATKLSLLQQKYHDELVVSMPLNSASSAIDRDDASILDQMFEQSTKDQKPDQRNQQRLILALLHLSTISGSKRCIERLLARIGSLDEFGDHLHWLVIKTGRMKKLHARQVQAQNTSKIMGLSTAIAEAIEQLVHIIHRLGFQLTAELHKKDSFGRLPLHHAVEYGLLEVCQEILKYMKGCDVDHSSIASNSALIPDSEGVTALDLAVLTSNAAITELLLEDHRHSADARTNSNISQVGLLPGKLLTAAVKSSFFTIVQLLRTSVIDVNHKDYHDESALYLAVRLGRLEYVNVLLAESDGKEKIDIDSLEAVYGWTPLILACVKGELPIVERLLRAGADPSVRDVFGWTAHDHAAFRGYLPMAKMLIALGSGSDIESAQSNGLHKKKQHIRKGSRSLDSPVPGSLGEDVPPGHSQVYVNLGPLDTYKRVTAVNLSPYVSPDPYNPQREADFQVEICGIDEDQSSHVIQLPILEDMANKPYRFVTENAGNLKLAFNIYHADTATHERGPLIGSAVALLESLKQGLGSTRESLIRDSTIPILKKDTLTFIGALTFYFVVITPFPHPCPMSVVRQELAFGAHDSPTIIGHRGSFQ
jgi:glycerophosphodiester phosphodiesterase